MQLHGNFCPLTYAFPWIPGKKVFIALLLFGFIAAMLDLSVVQYK